MSQLALLDQRRLVLRDQTFAGITMDWVVDPVCFHGETRYQEVVIGDTETFGRCLFMDGLVQSAEHDEAIYHSALVHPAMFLHDRPQRVLIGGGGEGATLREVLKHSEVEVATMVDIDRVAVEACRAHLPTWHAGAYDDPRAEVRYEDVRAVCEVAEPESYDVVILDLGDPSQPGPSTLAYTREFFQMVKRVLAPGGVVASQCGEFDLSVGENYPSLLATFRDVFGHTAPYRQMIPSFFSTWGFVLASDRVIDPRPTGALERFARIGAGNLPGYDPDGLAAMMWVPPAQRQAMRRVGRVLTDRRPLVS